MSKQRLCSLNRGRTTRRGAAAVEFSVTFAVLLLLLFAGFEFFRVSMIRHGASHAAYVAARSGIVPGATVANVNSTAQSHLVAAGIRSATVTVFPNPIVDATELVNVTVTVPLGANSWLVPRFMSPTLVAQTRLITERNDAMNVTSNPSTSVTSKNSVSVDNNDD